MGIFGSRASRRLPLGLLGLALASCDPKPTQEPPAPEPAQKAELEAANPTVQAEPEKAKEGSLRLVVVAPGEPLGSEKVQLQELEAALRKGKLELNAAPSSAQEAKLMSDLVSGKTIDVSPWSKFETVVLLQLVKPVGSEKGQRISRGRGHLFILHPPDDVPSFSTVYETEDKGAWLEGGKLGVWLLSHLRYRKGEDGAKAEPEKHEPSLEQRKAE